MTLDTWTHTRTHTPSTQACQCEQGAEWDSPSVFLPSITAHSAGTHFCHRVSLWQRWKDPVLRSKTTRAPVIRGICTHNQIVASLKIFQSSLLLILRIYNVWIFLHSCSDASGETGRKRQTGLPPAVDCDTLRWWQFPPLLPVCFSRFQALPNRSSVWSPRFQHRPTLEHHGTL